jgi:hypothetical protein
MGLDNGIRIEINEITKKVFPNKVRRGVSYYTGTIEIAYWRKCWNVRSAIYNCIDAQEENDYCFPLNEDNIKEIIKALKGFNSKNWEKGGGSIWSFEEQKPIIKKQIKNLKKLLRAIKRYGIDTFEPYFYDSY